MIGRRRAGRDGRWRHLLDVPTDSVQDTVGRRVGTVWRRWRSWVACERGSFTAELAAGLPAARGTESEENR